MSARLLEILEDIADRKSSSLLLSLRMLYDNKDWKIEEAHLRYDDPDGDAAIALKVGLRSSILSSFPRFTSTTGEFSPCDIPALVPLVALIANGSRGLEEGDITQANTTQAILKFGCEGKGRSKCLKDLAIFVNQFMSQWEQWVRVLLGTLARDPHVGDWKIDWYEWLAGESGYATMPWFPEIPLTDRALALDRIIVASRALLNSVLKAQFQKQELVENLINWMDGLRPIPEVLRAEVFAEQEVV